MYSLEIIDPVQDQRWNRFVNLHKNGRIYHSGNWKSVVEESFNHIQGFYFVLLKENMIHAALPIFFVQSWIAGKKFVSIPFATLCDPLISNIDEMYLLFDGVLQFSKRFKIKQIEIRTVNTSPILKQMEILSESRYIHHYLPLQGKLETIYKNFHRSCIRQRISRAEKSDIIINKENTEKEFLTFYNLYIMTRKRLGLPPQPFLFIHNLWKKFSPHGQAKIVLAEKGQKSIAALLLLLFKKTVTAEFAVVNKQYDSISPLHLLFWNSIKYAKQENFNYFDFGRTALDNLGLINFKNRWGTESIKLNFFYFPNSSLNKNIDIKSTFSYKLVNNIIKAAPKFVLNPIGKIMYSHYY